MPSRADRTCGLPQGPAAPSAGEWRPSFRTASVLSVRVWVAKLRISERVEKKITEDHGITSQQVRTAVERVEGLEGAWDYDVARGLRAIIEVEIGGGDALVVLYPADDIGADVWRLGSAYFIRR